MFLTWRTGQTEQDMGAARRGAHQFASPNGSEPSTRATNVSDASPPPQGASPAMSYAMPPPQDTPAPYPSPTVNHAQQPLAGPQAPTPPQQQQHGQGQAGVHGGGQTPRPGTSQSPYTSQRHPQPGPPHPHPHPQALLSQNPQLRADVMRILANTTNHCIADVNHQNLARLQYLEEENRRLDDSNTKLFQDNTKIMEAVNVERQRLAAINLTQTQQGWVKTCTELQNELAAVRKENDVLKNDRDTLATRCSELNALTQHLQAQITAARNSESEVRKAYAQIAARLNSAEQTISVFQTHGKTCPSFQQQFSQFAAYVVGQPRRASSQAQGQMPQQPAQGYNSPLSTMPLQQHALIQQRMVQQQQRRASTSMIVNGQRTPSQPGTPVIASATMSAPPGAYFGGRPVSQLQNATASSSRPPSAQAGQSGYFPTPAQGLAMGPPQQALIQSQQNQLHVRTPSQPFAHVNGVTSVGPNGLPGPQSSGGRSNPSTGQPMPIQNTQTQNLYLQQAALNARAQQQQQRFQQYQLQQQQQLQQPQPGAPSPAGQVHAVGSLQQPVPTKPHTPVPNSRPAPSPSPQIFSNALMHSNSNSSQPGLHNIHRHSRPQSVISVSSSSSRPNSSASNRHTQLQGQMQAPSPQTQSTMMNAAQAGMAGVLNQQEVRGQYQGIPPRPQSQNQNQNAGVEIMQHYQQFHQQRLLQQQAQQQPPQFHQEQQSPQLHSQQQLPQLHPQQHLVQSSSYPSASLIPVRPSPETQPPPPSGSTDGSFVADQAQTSSTVEGNMVDGTSQAGEEAPSTPMPSYNVGTSISTPIATKRGSVVLEGLGDEESRKKMRMSEEGAELQEGSEMNVDENSDLATNEGSVSSVITTAVASASQSDAGVEDDGDEEEEEEDDNVIGPDGLRTIESCLESFFAKEGETRTCRMCTKRHATGLIPAPVSFTNAQDQDLVDHCLAEHDVVWNRARHDV